MTDRELMQQAADVLQAVRDTPASKDEIQRAWIVSDLLRRRLAQQEQCQYPDCKCATENPCLKGLAQPEQEPVAWRWKERINGDFDSWVISASEPPPYAIEQQPLYTAPPQRKPLTDEQIDALVIDKDGLPNSHLEFARAIEAAHGIKGEA